MFTRILGRYGETRMNSTLALCSGATGGAPYSMLGP